jgi:hypothetical protein
MLFPSDRFDYDDQFPGGESDWLDRLSGYFTPRVSDDDSEVAISPMQPILSPSPSSSCESPQQSIGRKGARRELDAAEDVSIRCVKPVSTQEWAEIANLLFSGTPPQPPIDRPPKCRCLCIACAGPSNAKPSTTPCLVCGATILFSICQNKTSTFASPSTAPVMCFNCKVFAIAFTAFDC